MSMEIQAALDAGDETDSFLQITDVIYDKESELGYDQLRPVEKVVYCIDGLLREMENGGFAQFFRQQAGAFAEDTLIALEQIKAKTSLSLLKQIVDLFPNGQVPVDDDERDEVFDQIESDNGDEIIEYDDRFYDSGENLVGLTLHFVQKNLKEFR